MKKIRESTLLLLTLLASYSSIASEKNNIEISEYLKSGEKLSVVLNFADIDKNFAYQKPLWWGAEFIPPKLITSSVSVTLNGQQCWVPFSSYSDLVNINSAKVDVSEDGFKITIDGGQSATRYIAHLYFDNKCFITSRKVYSPMFPDEVWAETTYSFIRRTDM